MFSANENIALRQHKRRVTSYVESTIPESALDLGTMVMAMQVSCKSPGCVPLETAVAIIFPRGQKKELIPGLPESAGGGTFKTKILMPMAEVTKDDVLDALPPQFEGGRRTMERLCLRARDVMLGQIGQIIGEDDLEGRRLMAEYLMGCLRDYAERDCVAPDVGEPFPPLLRDETGGAEEKEKSSASSTMADAVQRGIKGTGNFVVRRVLDDDVAEGGAAAPTANSMKEVASFSTGKTQSAGNATTQRVVADNDNDALEQGQPSSAAPSLSTASAPNVKGTTGKSDNRSDSSQSRRATAPTQSLSLGESATDWRRRQNLNAELSALESQSSQNIIQQLSEREHAPGVRRPGCPCCDPDNPANYVDSMMML